MATTGARRRPRQYPDELRERAVRMVFEVRRETGESHGVITRVARDLGVGAESLLGEPSGDRLGEPAGHVNSRCAADLRARA